ncbi:MAG: cyclic pyranopterin monophosphate synthase MoaC [Candidatus Hydrogenedentota bacterium]
MFSHVNEDNQPAIVDVSGKAITHRIAHARTLVRVPSEILEHFRDGDIHSKKGPVFQTAILAGVMASKKTWDLIPLCHPISLEDCQIAIDVNADEVIQIDCTATATHKTGVEMEALTGATVAALTIYDMCKGMSHDITIEQTRLIEKRGGKKDYHAPNA